MSTDTLSAEALEAIAENGWFIPPTLKTSLSSTDLEGVVCELGHPGRTLENYRSRLVFHGMGGHERVLDFGCGFGQWSIAMALDNEQVVGIDKAEQRIAIGEDLRRHMNVKNLTFASDLDELETGSLENSFDAIFCYSVFMFLPGQQFIQRFAEILRPGGRLYIMVDLPGWHLRTLSKKPQAILGIGYMTLNTFLKRERNIIYTRHNIEALVTKAGFRVVDSGSDYTASFLPQAQRPERIDQLALDGSIFGLPILHEICAEKI